MQLSAPGADFVRHHEGFVDHAYADPVGILTIGIGFTWASQSFRGWWGKNRPGKEFGKDSRMTRAEADDALRYMVDQEYGAAVSKFLGARKVAQYTFDAMASAVYNLGAGALRWKWASAVKSGDLTEAARLLRKTGTTAKGRTLKGLVSRRKEEAELLALGDYTIGQAVYADPLADGMLVRGERGQPVLELQRSLAALGHYAGVIDGIFGYGTEAAVIAFQRQSGLTADGWAGPKTLKAIEDAVFADPEPIQPAEPLPPPTGAGEAPAAPRSQPAWLPVLIIAVLAAIVGAAVWLLQSGGLPAEPVSDIPVPRDRPLQLLGGPGGSLMTSIALEIAMSFVGPLIGAAATAIVGWIVFWWQRLFRSEFDTRSAEQLHAALARGMQAAVEVLGARAGRAQLLAYAADYAEQWTGGAVRHFRLARDDLEALAMPHLASAKAVLK